MPSVLSSLSIAIRKMSIICLAPIAKPGDEQTYSSHLTSRVYADLPSRSIVACLLTLEMRLFLYGLEFLLYFTNEWTSSRMAASWTTRAVDHP